MAARPAGPALALAVGVGLAIAGASGASAAGGAPVAAPAVTGQGTVYLVQGVDGTTMTFTVDGRTVATAAPAKRIVGPLRLSPGSHVVTASPGTGSPVRASLEVRAGSSTDAVLHRQADVSRPPVITAYPNDLDPVTAGSGRLTVAHTAAVGPADIRVKGKVLFANVANGEELTLTVPSGTYPVDIVPTATSGPVVFGPVDLPVRAASLTRVFAIGVAATRTMDAAVHVLPVGTRGSGNVVARVDAGNGGQAQALIDAHRPGARPGGVAPGGSGLLAAGLALVGASVLWRRRRWGRTN